MAPKNTVTETLATHLESAGTAGVDVIGITQTVFVAVFRPFVAGKRGKHFSY
jgi:hypothetical protein